MPDPVEEVSILASDLVGWFETLGAVYSHFQAHDLAEQYRKLDQRPRRSPLTNATADALAKMEAYVEAYVRAGEEETGDE